MINNLSKLQWACRRGMLELDVLLGNFLKEAYFNLELADKHRFINLLTHQDPELYAWLLGQESPEEEGAVRIIEKIRNHARARF